MNPNDKIALNVTDVAQMLGLSRPTVYKLCNREDFPVARIGGRVLIPREKLKAWIEAQAEEKTWKEK